MVVVGFGLGWCEVLDVVCVGFVGDCGGGGYGF